MDNNLVSKISISIIQSGVSKPTALDSQHVVDCREIIDMYNNNYHDPMIKEKIKKLLINMNLTCNEAEILEFISQIKALYLDNYT